jgi:hypothetical protein
MTDANPDIAALRARLQLTADRIVEWRADAKRLREVMGYVEGPVDRLVLLDMEETSGAIYREIEEFDALVLDIDRKSHAAAGQIAEVGDALRLVLMEITELGTAMYSRETQAEAANA